jgi:hypothetical protein
MHDALHIALRALGAIGKTQEVDHFGLPLPQQDLPDCSFYILVLLVCWITGEFQPPRLWPFITRFLRCWTDFQALRQLRHDGAIPDVLGHSSVEFLASLRNRQQQQQIVSVAQVVAIETMPVLQRHPDQSALAEIWELVIAALPGAEEQRRKSKRKELKRQLLAGVLKEASRLAEAAYVKEERPMPKQLCTTGPVMASASAPLGAQAKWKEKYDDLIQSSSRRTSMNKNPCR